MTFYTDSRFNMSLYKNVNRNTPQLHIVSQPSHPYSKTYVGMVNGLKIELDLIFGH